MPGRDSKVGGLLILVGYFACLCALIMLLTAGWRAWREYRIASRWVTVTAYVKNCGSRVDHPFARDGGGTVYSLRCRLDYQVDSRQFEQELRTTSAPNLAANDRIELWASHHGKGTMLPIKVNPSDPAEFVVLTPLPVEQFYTARQALITALAFAIGAALLFTVGRYCLRSKKEMSSTL